MNRRASLPGADELFRTSEPRGDNRGDNRGQASRSRRDAQAEHSAPAAAPSGPPEASGRVKHDQKITGDLTEQELLDLEQARLRLRAEFDISVDRGRIVREGVAELLADLHEHGPDAAIVRRLS